MSETQPLPTPAEIEACTNIIADEHGNNRGRRVVRIGNYVAKYGGRVTALEAENTLYLAAHTKLPLAKCHGYGYLPESKQKYILMDFIDGDRLDVVWPTLDQAGQEEVTRQLREQITEYRNLPDPGYIGSVGRQPLIHHFWRPQTWKANHLETTSPFDTHAQMMEAMVKRVTDPESASMLPGFKATMELRRLCLREVFSNKKVRTVWAHTDLAPKNIMVRKNGTGEDGSAKLEVVIIDWESAGWFPEWWEWASNECLIHATQPWFATMLLNVMPVYAAETFVWASFEEILRY